MDWTIGAQAGTDFLTNIYNNHQQQKMLGLNYRYNEKAADNADARQRKQYEDYYSPAAQLKQLQDAGLSPSLMYGNGSGVVGSAQGAQGSGAQGPSAIPMQATQFALMQAQIKNLDSQANKNNAEAKDILDTLPEDIANIQANTQESIANAQKLAQDKLKGEAQTKVLQQEENLKRLQAQLAEATYGWELQRLIYQCEQDYEQLQQLKRQNLIDELTFNELIGIRQQTYKNLQADYWNTVADTKLKKAQKNMTDEQKNVYTETINEIKQKAELYRQQGLTQQQIIEKLKIEIENIPKDRAWRNAFGTVDRIIDAADTILPIFFPWLAIGNIGSNSQSETNTIQSKYDADNNYLGRTETTTTNYGRNTKTN